MRDCPSEVTEVSSVTPEISPSRRSMGAATVAAIMLGSAPGRLTLTLMVGNSTLGRLATVRNIKATGPTRNKPIASSVVPIGRRMNGEEKFTGGPEPGAAVPAVRQVLRRAPGVRADAPCKDR